MRANAFEEGLLATEKGEKIKDDDGQDQERDLLQTYGRLRCTFDILYVGFGLFANQGANSVFAKPLDVARLPLILLNLIAPSAPSILALHAQRIATNIYRLPFIWDMDYYMTQMDLAFLLSALAFLFSRRLPPWRNLSVADGNALITVCAPLVCNIECILYFGAGFWKVNRAFMDWRVCCASVIFLQEVANYVPAALTPAWLPVLVARAGPYMGAGVEMGMPTLLFFPGWPRYIGMIMQSGFSLDIAYCPPPNNAGVFSLVCMSSSTFCFLPRAQAQAWKDYGSLLIPSKVWDIPRVVRRLGLSIATFCFAYAVYSFGLNEIFMGPGCLLLSLGVVRAIFLDATGRTVEQKPKAPVAKPVRVVSAACYAITFYYSFVAQTLGTQELSNQGMYASLNVGGGGLGNHYILPTGLMQYAFATRPDLVEHFPVTADSFGGGLVRVEHTDAPILNAFYPGEFTPLIPNEAMELIEQIGAVKRSFGFEDVRIMGLEGVSPPQGIVPVNPTGEGFVEYTYHALELRRALALARDSGTPFSLVYTRPPAFTYPVEDVFNYDRDELPTGFVRITYVWEGTGHANCTYDTGKPCAPDEIALQGPPTGWGRKLIVHNPHPIIKGSGMPPGFFCRAS